MMTESEVGSFLSGLAIATLIWLALLAVDNEILPRHYEAAYRVCAVNEDVESIEGGAFFSRYGFTVTCNNGAEFDIPWAESTRQTAASLQRS